MDEGQDLQFFHGYDLLRLPKNVRGWKTTFFVGFLRVKPVIPQGFPNVGWKLPRFSAEPIILGPKPIIIEQKQQNLVAAWLKDSCQAQRIQTAESSSNIGWPGTQGRTLIRTEPTTSLE